MLARRGFTLIEILTVILVFGILVSVTSYVYSSSLIRSRDTQRKTDLGTIKNAQEQFYSDNHEYVDFSLSCLAGDPKCPGGDVTSFDTFYQLETSCIKVTGVAPKASGKCLAPYYLTTIPQDPIYKSTDVNNRGYAYLPNMVSQADRDKVKSYWLGALMEAKNSWSTSLPDFGSYTVTLSASPSPSLVFCYNALPGQLQNCTSSYYVKNSNND